MIKLKRSYIYVAVPVGISAENLAAIKALFKNKDISNAPALDTDTHHFMKFDMKTGAKFQKTADFSDYDIALEQVIGTITSSLDRNAAYDLDLYTIPEFTFRFTEH